MDWLIKLIVITSLAILTAIVVIFTIRKKRNQKRRRQRIVSSPSHMVGNRRKPVVIENLRPASSSRRSVSNTHRLPRPADDLEYLTYRKCPACRTVNTKAAQYIFKTGENRFECRRCGEKFIL